MRSPKSLHNLQNDEGGNYMAETETETVINNQTSNIIVHKLYVSPIIPQNSHDFATAHNAVNIRHPSFVINQFSKFVLIMT